MLTVPDIIAMLGGPSEVGRICGFSRNPGARGHDLKTRGSIPARYWPAIVAAAVEKGKADITLDALAEIHAKKWRPGCSEASPSDGATP
jgi:hypothetical protein